MQTMTLIRGIPGSGKTTLALELKDSETDHWEGDMYFVGGDGVYRYNPAKRSQASAWCVMKTIQSLINGRNVIVANTFFKYTQMIPYIELASRLGVNIKIVECKGKFQNIHNVPEDVMETMVRSFEDYSSFEAQL